MNSFLVLLSILIKFAQSQNCEICQNLVKEFHVGIKDSDKGNFGGGNTAWEEERLGSFATSETRLIHILDGLCPSATKNIEKCHYMREESEEQIEKWWFNVFRKENKPDSLYNYLCVNHMNVCCPNNHYGKDCERCVHYDASQDKMCSGHGICSGNGTREGNGTCICDIGYEGEACDLCIAGYFKTINGTCDLCDKACLGCTEAGTDHCVACNAGYENRGTICEDVNECLNKTLCSSDQFCNNIDGSYECKSCDPSCKECTGSESNLCSSCNVGYQLVGSTCEDINECESDIDLCKKDGQICKNTVGSYTCDCLANYEKQADGSCIPTIAQSESRDDSEL